MDILKKDNIHLNQSFSNKEEAIRFTGQVLVDGGYVSEEYIDEMIQREHDLSTYMGNYIAIPHGTENSNDMIKKSGLSVIQVPKGINFGTKEEEKEVRVIFGIAGVDNQHLDILSNIAIYASEVENVLKLAEMESKEEILGELGGIE